MIAQRYLLRNMYIKETREAKACIYFKCSIFRWKPFFNALINHITQKPEKVGET